MKREISPAVAIGVIVAILVVAVAYLWMRPSSSNGGIPEQKLRAARQRLEAALPPRGAPLTGNRYAAPAGGTPPAAQAAQGAPTQ